MAGWAVFEGGGDLDEIGGQVEVRAEQSSAWRFDSDWGQLMEGGNLNNWLGGELIVNGE